MPSEPKKYEGLSGAMRTSPWLAGEDLVGIGDIEAEIEDVYVYDEVAFEQGRVSKNVFTLKFVGKQKQLVLNSTNRKAIVRVHGSDTKNWRGKKIKLYFEPAVRMKGVAVGGLRVKA